MKVVKVPSQWHTPPHYHNVLEMEGISIVESCVHAHGTKSVIYLEDHLLLFVLEGTYKIKVGNTHFDVNKNQMILLKKSTCMESYKAGNPEKDFAFESMMFFLKDSFLLDFLRTENIRLFRNEEPVMVFVRPFGAQLLKYLESLQPFFRNPADEINAGLYRIKMLELLYYMANADKNLLLQLIQLKQQQPTDIPRIMEENYLNPVTLTDLAYLSGRSLSSFRRDFESIYETSPAKWIQEKRLEKAKELLLSTEMTAADICYAVGYENLSHFSRLYKSFWGHNPSEGRKELSDQ